MPANTQQRTFYQVLKAQKKVFSSDEIARFFKEVDIERIELLASRVSEYIESNLPKTFGDKNTFQDYRTNPYVLMTSASVLDLDDEQIFARFLFDTKFYMGLETSFGKSVETTFVESYPISGDVKWSAPIEKINEFIELEGLGREERAVQRTKSFWREIDKSVVIRDRRFIVSIKSGPNTINDTQVEAMRDAIVSHHKDWALATHANYPDTRYLDIVIGLTYGTDRTTNNKENQILAKLLDNGFVEEDRERLPGVLIDKATRTIRVYRVIGRDFWAFFGDPISPKNAEFAFLEVLLALVKALQVSKEKMELEEKINLKIKYLSQALAKIQLSPGSLPAWMKDKYSEDELFWLTTAISSFYDEGI